MYQETNKNRFAKVALIAAISLASASAFALSTSASPGGNFNLGGFTLQLPTGSKGNVDTVSGSQLESGYTKKPYFYTDSGDGSMVMADAKNGWATSGSSHSRTEFRENAIWSTSGTNILTATLAVTKVPKTTAIGQIFQGTGPSKPLCELQFTSSGNVQLLLEDTNQGGASSTTKIASVSVGSKFTYSMQYLARRLLSKSAAQRRPSRWTPALLERSSTSRLAIMIKPPATPGVICLSLRSLNSML
jgi:hypothetical protein